MASCFKQDEKGFTLIELLIVVAIVGMLAAIAVPNMMSGQQRARYSRSAGDTRQIVTQAQVLMSDSSQVVNAACKNPMPGCLWDGSAPNGIVYMAKVTDPWAPPGTTYRWNQAPGLGCGAASPGCVVYSAWTVGADGAPGVWDGIVALGGDDLGNSTLLGCAFGPGLPTTSPC
ncbi:MAG: general secretion pathway protein G [candidate division NC10 bacterium CSP1-5]|nr:MAG: general secretion pathway protein G [candidate division NC10 bacterium CSP1-5]HZY30874.1 type II secretion system protein [Candidatus Methylomirabilis sp.]